MIYKSVFLLFFYSTMVSCQNYGKLELVTQLPKTLEEVSGMVQVQDKIIAINDSGNDPSLWVYSQDKLLVELKVANARNRDWEDLAYDPISQELYVGDFGNNDNERKDLTIYKISLKNVDLSEPQQLQSTALPYYYDDQTEYPPKKKNYLFDCEAFIVSNGYFYLFTRNRAKDFNGKTSVYRLPIYGSSKKAVKLTEIEICNDDKDCQVTSAAINDGTIALLTSDKVFLIRDYDSDFKNYDLERMDLNHYSQKESIDFKNSNTIIIADEESGNDGRSLYQLKL